VDQQRQSSIVENCFDAFNQRDLDAVMDCFEETVSYEDTIFEGGATNKKELRARFQRAMETFPPKVIVDEIASCPTSGKVGARWHLEIDNFSGSNTPLPFSKGCSFYTTNLKTGLIETGFRVMETPLKPDDAIFNLLMVPTKVMERLSPSPASSRIDDDKNEPEEFPSIIDKAYWRWNKRDMNGAVECFSDNMYLEDTLYLKPIQGKEALRKHYARIAEQVPSICKIVLDDIAQDPVNGNIAARWHLEVKNDDNNDINLLEGWSRGCSMYTTDPDTGLIRSGLDVTESPVKVNEAGLNLLLSPLQLLKR
jgi:ketosteroid isomerase-like protein